MNNLELLADSTIAEIVADDYRTAEVFKKNGIDFCCGGRKNLAKVCAERNIDLKKLEEELVNSKLTPVPAKQNFSSWTLTFLADYIQNVHHSYVNNNLTLISEFAEKVARVHGQHNPETVMINDIWKKLTAELTVHMKKEELRLFPYVKQLEKHSKGESDGPLRSHFGSVKNPISMMEQEHDMAGDLMHQINKLSANYSPPDYACNTYRVLYSKLKEFEEDLHQHVHLENNILFPKAVELEEKLSHV